VIMPSVIASMSCGVLARKRSNEAREDMKRVALPAGDELPLPLRKGLQLRFQVRGDSHSGRLLPGRFGCLLRLQDTPAPVARHSPTRPARCREWRDFVARLDEALPGLPLVLSKPIHMYMYAVTDSWLRPGQSPCSRACPARLRESCGSPQARQLFGSRRASHDRRGRSKASRCNSTKSADSCS
jgi:hypothetical protein